MPTNLTIQSAVHSVIASLERANWIPPDRSTQPPVELETIVAELGKDVPIDEHGVRWDPDAWWSGIRETYPDSGWITSRLSNLPASLILRAHVFALADGPPLEFFLATMAWGFGPVGYGWWRTASIGEKPGPEQLDRAVAHLRIRARQGPEEAWRAWKDPRAAQISGVGTAFASKLAYFAGFNRQSSRGPLIADTNTAWAIWALAGISNSRDRCSRYVHMSTQQLVGPPSLDAVRMRLNVDCSGWVLRFAKRTN
jgi:hypothetical protein